MGGKEVTAFKLFQTGPILRRKRLPWLTKPLPRMTVFSGLPEIGGQNRPLLNQYHRVGTQNQNGPQQCWKHCAALAHEGMTSL